MPHAEMQPPRAGANDGARPDYAPSTDHIAHGTPDALRQFIGETAALARIQAELAETYASIGDDVGLAYALRRLTAYVRAAVSTFADLRAAQRPGVRP